MLLGYLLSNEQSEQKLSYVVDVIIIIGHSLIGLQGYDVGSKLSDIILKSFECMELSTNLFFQ